MYTMESQKSTKLLNDIFAKLSLLTKEDEEAQGIVAAEQEVVEPVELQEEVTEPAVEKEEAVEAASEESTEEVTEEKVEMATEEAEASEEQLEESEELMEGYVTEAKYQEDMAKVMAMMEELKKKVDEEMGGYQKEKEMMSEQIEKLSAEPAAEPISPTPEDESPEKKLFTYGGQRVSSTFDRVMERIGNK